MRHGLYKVKLSKTVGLISRVCKNFAHIRTVRGGSFIEQYKNRYNEAGSNLLRAVLGINVIVFYISITVVMRVYV